MFKKFLNPVFLLYFISGFTALTFEVVWEKEAGLILGNTALAAACVVAAFMTGLAIGSAIFGRIADQKPGRTLWFYAALEGAIGLYVLFLPFFVGFLKPLYALGYHSFYQQPLIMSIFRFFLSFFILVLPTTAMGGTLPLLSRFLKEKSAASAEAISALYAVNLFGAVCGAFLCGFVFIGWIGLRATSVFAALMNLGIFLAATFYLSKYARATQSARVTPKGSPLPRGVKDYTSTEESHRRQDPRALKWILLLCFVQGFGSFVVQLCWTRTLSLILGSSTYAFSTVLTVFLAGLGLGSWAVSRVVAKRGPVGLESTGWVQALAGLGILCFMPMFEWLIYFFVVALPWVQKSVFIHLFIQFIFSAAAIAVPTFVIGLVFPLLLSSLEGAERDIGRFVGTCYSINTLGAVLGSFATAFWLIPCLGIQHSIQLAGLLFIFTGCGIVWIISEKTQFKRIFTQSTAVLCISGIFLMQPWDKSLFSSGVFVYAQVLSSLAKEGKKKFQKAIDQRFNLVYYKDGISSTVSVFEFTLPLPTGPFTARALRVNGKTDASTSPGDMVTQLYLGYMPMFANPKAQEVLVIGLGSGVTLGTVAQFPNVKSVDCVEIEPAVIEAGRYFSVASRDVLKNPRVRMIVGDGRNHIQFTDKKYDVIISEPSNPWIAGISYLFTRENYKLALDKLSGDGVYCQWFHAYQMSKEDFTMIIRTFASVFPNVSLFRIDEKDYFLLGSRKEIVFDGETVRQALHGNLLMYLDIARFFSGIENFFLQSFAGSDKDIREALGREKPLLNTDDRLLLEYHAPKYLYANTDKEISDWVYSVPRSAIFPGVTGWGEEKFRGASGALKIFSDGGQKAILAGNYDGALLLLKEAALIKPEDGDIRYRIGKAYELSGRYAAAAASYDLMGRQKGFKKRSDAAKKRAEFREKMDRSLELRANAKLYEMLAKLSFSAKDFDEAIVSAKRSIELDPYRAKVYADLAVYYFMKGFREEGRRMLSNAGKIDPDEPSLVNVRALEKKRFP